MNQLPNQPPNTFNADAQNPNVLDIPEQEISSSSWGANPESGYTPTSEKIVKKLKRIYVILLVIGLIIGGVVSVGVVTLLNKLDPTDLPERMDERRE